MSILLFIRPIKLFYEESFIYTYFVYSRILYEGLTAIQICILPKLFTTIHNIKIFYDYIDNQPEVVLLDCYNLNIDFITLKITNIYYLEE